MGLQVFLTILERIQSETQPISSLRLLRFVQYVCFVQHFYVMLNSRTCRVLQAFDAARKEVDTADEAALRAERVKLRRSASIARQPAAKLTTGNLLLRMRDRSQSDQHLDIREQLP